MPRVFELAHSVANDEIDTLGHANNQVYLAWILKAATSHSAAQGWAHERYLSLGGCWVVRRHEIEYLNQGLAGDKLVIRTWVSTMERVTSERRYEILRVADGKILAKASTLWVWIDMKSGKPARIPAEIASSFDVVTDTQGRDIAPQSVNS